MLKIALALLLVALPISLAMTPIALAGTGDGDALSDDIDFGGLEERRQDSGDKPAIDGGKPQDAPQQPEADVPEEDDKEYDRVDWGNQDGPREARDNLARVIGTSKIGYDRSVLAAATRQDLLALDQWFNQVGTIAPDFTKNTAHARKKMKGEISEQTNHSIYEARTKGLGDKQDDKDDFRIVKSFLQFTKDQNPPSPFLGGIADKVVDLIVAAGPAYKVPITAEEAGDPAILSQKFERDLDKGALQFAAIYLQGLMLDSNSFEAAGRMSLLPPSFLTELNSPRTLSRLDNGAAGQEQVPEGRFQLLDNGRVLADRAGQEVQVAQRAFAESIQGLNGPATKWSREDLLKALADNPEANTAKIAAALQRLDAARGNHMEALAGQARLEQDAVAAEQVGTTLNQRFKQATEVLGEAPDGVSLSGPLKQHRSELRTRLDKVNQRDMGSVALYLMQNDKERLAQLIEYQNKLDRAVTYQTTSEENLGKLQAQKSALQSAAEAMELDSDAPPALKQRVEAAKQKLEAQNQGAWETGFWEARSATGVRSKAESISQELSAIGQELQAISGDNASAVESREARARLKEAQAQEIRNVLADQGLESVAVNPAQEGAVKADLEADVSVLDRQSERVGTLKPGQKTTFAAVLVSSRGGERTVVAVLVALPAEQRKTETVESGFLFPNQFAPTDPEALAAVLAAPSEEPTLSDEERAALERSQQEARQGSGDDSVDEQQDDSSRAGTGDDEPEEDEADEQQNELPAQTEDQKFLGAYTQLWSSIQIASSNLEHGNHQYVLHIENNWTGGSNARFKTAISKRMSDKLGLMEQYKPNSTPRNVFSRVNLLTVKQPLDYWGVEESAVAWAKTELKDLVKLLNSRSDSAQPRWFEWGKRMQFIGPAE